MDYLNYENFLEMNLEKDYLFGFVLIINFIVFEIFIIYYFMKLFLVKLSKINMKYF